MAQTIATIARITRIGTASAVTIPITSFSRMYAATMRTPTASARLAIEGEPDRERSLLAYP